MGPANKTDVQLPVPAAVAEVLAKLRSASGVALIVGGAVRDALGGLSPDDFDLATSLLPEQLVALFADAEERDVRLGAVRLRGASGTVTITSFREEGGYRDRRHPDWVRFVTDPRLDAMRRDFTVNAIYYDDERRTLFDPCGGLEDLQAKRLRTIGAPSVRLREDPLRLLRGVRFAARVGLSLDDATALAMRQSAALVHGLSAERSFAELTAAFVGPSRGRALRLLVDLGLANELLPEVAAMDGVPQPEEYHPEGDVLTHTCLVLDHVTPADPVQAWAAVLHDIGKPPTFERAADRIRFSGHDVLSARMAEAVLRRLRAPRHLLELVSEICRDHIRFAVLPQMAPGKRERWLRSPHFAAHLDFHRADCSGSHGDLTIWQMARAWLTALPPEPPPPLCRGSDVIALGVPPGPLVGEALRRLQGQLDAIESKDRGLALRLLEDIVASLVKHSD